MGLASRIADLEGLRRDQQEAGVDVRVLGAPPALVTPSGEPIAPSMVRAMNDHLAEVVTRHPDTLAGLATIDAFVVTWLPARSSVRWVSSG